jgi:tRNA 5-methylaminomethyl-2-thiouridine biosynthesis bifunctional protein
VAAASAIIVRFAAFDSPMPSPAPTLQWRDGQPWSSRFDDRYFSSDSGLDETRHVFLQGNRLVQRFAALRPGEVLRIGETGFGTGLNFLCSWDLFSRTAPDGAALVFRSVERWPLAPAELHTALALWPVLQPMAEALLMRWAPPAPGHHRWNFGAVSLELDIDDVTAALPAWPAAAIDAWFLDGFAPAKNPEMWSDAVLAHVARTSRPGATLASYTSAGWVRRGLQAAGFSVQRVPGHGQKRQMLVGRRTGG